MIAGSADVDSSASIGRGTTIWHLAQVRERAVIGENCVIGRGAYIDHGVTIGANCKVQNYALVYAPALLEDGVFIGPAAMLTNDLYPRAVNSDGSVKAADDWEPSGVVVRAGASVGGAAVILPGVEIGEWAMVAAGAVVTRSVPSHALVVGSPARAAGWVGRSGRRLEPEGDLLVDPATGEGYRLSDEGVTPA